ncbi:YceI-like domain-containing protein [Salinimicrobium catena]|uniref:YceI-like domain-containing protein n=1 Tax=Salinimicrobium catena TaxID=390640 RepID=A0A1H5HDF0_9FLAO|nr:YceI family protein [Salinimicrobium catena]SDK69319.1 YceI-like domain-containing protein [Salinimicrobium catena]SEE25875.1 YceI-like domain-containing protein [Salinimicrobium catena]
MNTTKNFWLVLGSFLVMIFSANTIAAQSYNLNSGASNLKVEGTSNIHDWEMTAKDFQGTMKVEMEDGQLVKIDQLDFAVVAESLKSGKGGMDKNAYKALNTDDHKKITYKLEKVNNIDCTSSSSCKVTTSGYLTIAGTRKLVDITFDAKVNGNQITLSGSKKINMTDYKVDPPTAMFGTITTGEEVNIKFQAAYSK